MIKLCTYDLYVHLQHLTIFAGILMIFSLFIKGLISILKNQYHYVT